MRRVARVTSAALAALAAGCASGDRAGTVSFRDSAGVTIAENAPAAAQAVTHWTIEQPALLTIGVLEGDSAYQFYHVGGAALLADGRIAILDAGSRELRFFASDGRHIGSVGREGEGPGEFRAPFPLVRFAEDSLLVWDQELQRFSVFDDEGALVRVAALDRSVLNPFLAGVFDDGHVLIGDHRLEVPPYGFAPTIAEFVRYTPAGAFADSVGGYPWMEIGRIGEADHGMVGGRTFAPRTSTAVRGERFWIGTGAEGSVDVRDRAGALRRIVRWDPGDQTVGPEDQARNLAERFGDAPPEVRRSFEQVPALERFPAYGELGADAEGDLWVKAYRRPGQVGPDRWLVFDPEGALIARLETPASMRILEAAADRVLCVVSDEFDVERVALFALRKGG